MGGSASMCTACLSLADDALQLDCLKDDVVGPRGRRGLSAAEAKTAAEGPQLALRVGYAPTDQSLGAKASPFQCGDEVAVVKLDRIKGWAPLEWRQERIATQRAAVRAEPSGKVAWPDGPRFTAHRHWGGQVVASDGKGGFEEHRCLIQVAMAAKDREMDSVKLVVDDAKNVASYAARFNQHTAQAFREDAEPDEVPSVKVCAPVGCYVIGSAALDIAQPGEAVSLTVYPAASVTKFVFEGCEDFHELPQAFFHYVAWMSGGNEMLADLQGAQEENDFLIVDPVVLRAAQPTVTDLLGTVVGAAIPGGDAGKNSAGTAEARFDHWHQRCGMLCKSFDPQRRSVHARRHCGVALPTCGAGGA